MSVIERLDSAELADELGVKKHTLENWRIHGRGPRYRKFGHRVYYLREDVEAFVEASLRTSTSDHGREETVT